MTSERQLWWDSLPKEEKRVRQDIKRLMIFITVKKVYSLKSCKHRRKNLILKI